MEFQIQRRFESRPNSFEFIKLGREERGSQWKEKLTALKVALKHLEVPQMHRKRSGPFLSHSSISKGNSLRPALHHFLCTGKFLVQTGSYVPRHCCHTLLRYRFYSTKPSHALQESSLKYFKWKWIPKDTWPNYAIGVRRRKKLEGAGWRLFLEFLGSLDYMKKDLGRDKSKLKHLHRKQGSEATSISWTLPRTKQQHVFQNKWKKVFFPWRRGVYSTDSKSDHTEALPAKIMVFPDILKQHNLTTQCFIWHLRSHPSPRSWLASLLGSRN